MQTFHLGQQDKVTKQRTENDSAGIKSATRRLQAKEDMCCLLSTSHSHGKLLDWGSSEKAALGQYRGHRNKPSQQHASKASYFI